MGAGDVEIDDTTTGKRHIRIRKDSAGCIHKITEIVNGSNTVYRWKNGRDQQFQPPGPI